MTALLIILGIIVVLAVFIIGIYNRLVALRQTTNQAWSDIEVQLKQRQDLVPQLVNTVKGYASHERVLSKKWLRPAPPQWARQVLKAKRKPKVC